MAKGKRENKGLDFSPQCFTVSFTVYPPTAMVRENALKLATDLATHQELTDIHMSDETWTFRRPQAKGHARGQIEVRLEDQDVTIEHVSPNGGLERFEILVEQAVESIGAVIKPQVIFGCEAVLEYTANIGSDTRKAILGSLDMLGEEDETGKLDVFGRPCHFVGLRLGFPPVKFVPKNEGSEEAKDETEEGSDTGELMEQLMDEEDDPEQPQTEAQQGIDWHATLTLQSLQDDPNGLSVEVNGRWIGAVPWKKVAKNIVLRLRTVDEFLKTKTRDFLQEFRSEE
jgi:hypothetical protein